MIEERQGQLYEIVDFSLKCKVCELPILDNDMPKGWCGGVKIEIEHIGKDVPICLSCLNIIKDNRNERVCIVTEVENETD